MIPPEELNRLKAICEAATPGKWVFSYDTKDSSWPGLYRLTSEEVFWCGFDGEEGVYGNNENDFIFIRTARESLPRLIAEIERLRSEIVEAKRQHQRSLNLINAALCVPAAEYVPAIGDAFKLISEANDRLALAALAKGEG